MPLYPAGPKLGLGLWNSVPATMAVELTMYGVGLWIYFRASRARDKTGSRAFLSFAVFLTIAYFANLFGGAPPSIVALYSGAIAGSIVLMLWAWWVDRHREPAVSAWRRRRRTSAAS
jgi:hypothetical protein